MSKSMMLSLLKQGNTGSEILTILDVIAEGESADSSYNEPTADPIDF
jgi:hypothetical protein